MFRYLKPINIMKYEPSLGGVLYIVAIAFLLITGTVNFIVFENPSNELLRAYGLCIAYYIWFNVTHKRDLDD